jgi:hypothetical protein
MNAFLPGKSDSRRVWLTVVYAGAALSVSCESGGRQPSPSLAQIGDPCDADGDCESDFCQALPGLPAKCATRCEDGCTSSQQCEELGALGNPRYTCVPLNLALCKLCTTASDCPYPGDSCYQLGKSTVCGEDCSYDGSCPKGYTCADQTSVGSVTATKQCVPVSGTCGSSIGTDAGLDAAPPVASCSDAPPNAAVGSQVTFNGGQSTIGASGTSLVEWVWTFGDGTPTGSGVTVQHAYTAQGTFNPTLKVTDSSGNSSAPAACPAVTVTAANTCDGNYATTVSPMTQTCVTAGDTSFATEMMTFTENGDGTITASEVYDGLTITYSGTWSGSTFHLTGSDQQNLCNLDIITTNSTADGTFNGCESWTATWVDKKTDTLGIYDCTLAWTVNGTKL